MSNQHEHGGNIFAVARSLGLPPEQVLDFSASINPLGMAPGVRDALVGSLDRLLHYPDKSAQELKERLAAYHGVRSNQVVVANGSTEIIHRLPRIVTGKCALIVAPAFAEYAAALERAGWEIDYLTLQSDDVFRFSLASLEEKLASGVDLLFLCNPANPTGALVPRAEIAEVLRLCGRYGTFLALDEAFMDFCEEDSAKDVVAGGGNAIALRSMTKFFAIPGLRLGYAIGNAAVVAALEEFLEPWSVNTAAQVAGIASLEDESYCEETRKYVAQERARLAAGLDALGWVRTFPSAANFLLVKILDGGGAGNLKETLLRHGILIRDCSNFHGLDNRFFRLAVRRREENERLLALMRSLPTSDAER